MQSGLAYNEVMEIKPALLALLNERYPHGIAIGGKGKAATDLVTSHSLHHWQVLTPQALDVLIVWEWLEQQHDPIESLKHLQDYLKPTGDLWLVVPNVRYLPQLVALMQDNWPCHTLSDGVTPHPQVHFFTQEYLKIVLPQANWHPIEWLNLGMPFNAQGQAILAAWETLGWSTQGLADSHVAWWVVRSKHNVNGSHYSLS